MIFYHITHQSDWDAAKLSGDYRADTLSTQGFIHCSTAAQVFGVANRLFQGKRDLILLKIDESKVSAPVKYENLEGGQQLFPHIYGSLNLDAVLEILPFLPEGDGHFSEERYHL
jgi:uncharacterized protein (DUF952 family)